MIRSGRSILLVTSLALSSMALSAVLALPQETPPPAPAAAATPAAQPARVVPRAIPALPDPSDSLAAASLCDLLHKIVKCKIDGLTKRKEAKTALAAQVKALQEVRASKRDAPGVPRELLEALAAELERRTAERDAATSQFGDAQEAELKKWEAQKTYIDDYCAGRGWPEPYYSIQVGGEGRFDASSFSLTDEKLVADLFFAMPLAYLRTPHSVVRQLGTHSDFVHLGDDGAPQLSDDAFDSPRATDNRRLISGASSSTFPRSTSFGGATDLERTCQPAGVSCVSLVDLLFAEHERLQRAAKADKRAEGDAKRILEERRQKVAVAEDNLGKATAIAEFLQSYTGVWRGAEDAAPLVRVAQGQVEADRSALEEAQRDAGEAAEELAEIRKKLATVADSFCQACATIDGLIDALERKDLGEKRKGRWWRGAQDPVDPPRQLRVGPFLLPDQAKRQAAPIWTFTRVRNEVLADVSSGTAVDMQRLTASIGLFSPCNLGGTAVLGPYVSVGGIFGSVPGPDSPSRRHVLLEAGAMFQTRYRVAEIDKDKGISGVVGQATLAYRRDNYIKGQVAEPTFDRDVDRLIFDARLSFQELSSKTVRPLFYVTLDKSIHGSLHRDRVGVLLEVDLKTLFKAPTAQAAAQVKALGGSQ